ncbi:nucleolar GTP-binding protein-like protein 2 [Myriangium duriaei CBS 260.36]|uniref:Nucleolar GTP-binding protein-like protein 2 n=1 Tax=Myriangium duriaei CBS 260.36 TaxID=1168546 RepID=A0A9P4MMT7_9PEZI|nr:nucleolar GTP-binding protein-like protein 2 [Myriangium duriaei CBS 260.36]
MKVGKPKSKRTPVRLRHKIQKASANKQRKDRKDAKNNPEWRTRLKKDPGVPNLFPYKNKVLEEIEESRQQKEAEKQRRQEIAKAQRLGTSVDKIQAQTTDAANAEEEELLDLADDVDVDDEMDEDNANPMAALLASARARAAEYEQDAGDNDEMDEDDDEWGGLDEESDTNQATASRKDSSRKAFDKAFRSVIESSDVVLYVLDARDPDGTRSREVERSIMASDSGSKRLILILNKIDLIPTTVLRDWLRHLRRSFPTIPLRASTPSSNAKTFDHKALTVKGTSETLFRALKTYAHAAQMKRAITVGVIGYPNVGKSSVINALTSRMGKSSTACPTGAEAGVTTSLREVKIDNKLKLIDSPGIVFPSQVSAATSSGVDSKTAQEDDKARLILLNAVPPKDIADPVPAVSLLLRRLAATESGMQRLLDVYGIPPLMTQNGDATTDFLVQVARKRGRLGKGGVPNMYAAAMTVVADWWAGRVQGWLEAPSAVNSGVAAKGGEGLTGDQKEIVSAWSKEFKLEGLWGDDGKDVANEMAVES